MEPVDHILAVNNALQGHMRTHGVASLTPDEAAEVVYSAGIMSPDQGPPDAPGFTFRQFLRDLRDKYGYHAVHSLVGATQAHNRPGARWTLHRFDPPTREEMEAILGSPSGVPVPQEPPAQQDTLPDYLADGLDVVFVGTSVGEKSASRRHYYAHPTNKFWDLVNESNLVSDIVGAENDRLILDDKCGLTDLVKHKVSSSDADLGRADFDIPAFRQKILQYKPKVVAFNGKRAYKEVFSHDPKGYGVAEEDLGDSFVFVLPSSSGSDAGLSYGEKLDWYRKLKSFLYSL